MISLHTNSQNIDLIFRSFSKQISGTLNKDDHNYQFSFTNKLGDGKINGIELNKYITYIEYDVTFAQDVKLGKNMIQPNYVYFVYSLKGSPLYKETNSNSNREIREFRTCIYSSNIPSKAVLTFKKGVHYKLSIITIRGEENPNNAGQSITNKIIEHFKKDDKSKTFLHIGSFNLRIAEKLEKLNKIDPSKIDQMLLFKGLLQIILSMQLKQYDDDLEFQKNKMGSLTIKEIKNARALSDQIKKSPELQISISDMCRESGLSPCKLQEAFKLLHNKTANDFLRSQRLKMAEKLIAEKELNISEVVYTIGLSSRSYFSRIFKERYGCTPKSYQDNFSDVSQSTA